jgi:hypothetical protein
MTQQPSATPQLAPRNLTPGQNFLTSPGPSEKWVIQGPKGPMQALALMVYPWSIHVYSLSGGLDFRATSRGSNRMIPEASNFSNWAEKYNVNPGFTASCLKKGWDQFQWQFITILGTTTRLHSQELFLRGWHYKLSISLEKSDVYTFLPVTSIDSFQYP